MQKSDPEGMAKAVVDACADCDICRYLMEDTPCLLFPELYRLYDKEMEKRGRISPYELKNLVNLCNFCAICPCPNVRSDIMRAKHAFVRRDGITPAIRLLEDVERVAKVCGSFPRLANLLFETEFTGGVMKRLAGVHADRKVPRFPEESFATWARRRELHNKRGKGKRKVAYFAGCTGQYLFPDVPKAVVEVLQRNDIEVYFPEQKCCGMPSLLEGDRRLTFEFVSFNVDRLGEAVEAGYDIVCSCPTCGYMLKNVLSESACYSAEHREAAGSNDAKTDREKVASKSDREKSGRPGNVILEGLYKDEGYFAAMSASRRIRVAAHTYDLGEYLSALRRSGELNTDFGPVPTRMVYYPPCHLREQKIGEPYPDLLGLVPGICQEKIEGAFYCCGISGIMGFKRDFHRASIEMGSRLMKKIEAVHPERLVTDCLSCRIQFNQLVPYKVFHPVEVLYESYSNWSA